ncbi:MAG: SCO family protein [Granulosicoccus sp.]
MTNSSNTLHTGQPALPDIDPAVRRRSRIKLISIFAIFAVPLILASIYLHLVRNSGGTIGDTSRGQLISPAVPLTDFALQAGEADFTLDSVRGIWTMLYLPVGECQDVCEKNLYHMRQVRLALNHRMDRVQRAVLLQSPTQIDPAVLTDHPGLIAATGSEAEKTQLSGQLEKAQEGMDPLEDAIYLIDPFGNIMLRFPSDLEPKSMLKDIKHLLKVSRIG